MKKLILALVALIFVGCASSSSVLKLPQNASISNTAAPKKTLYIASIDDKRENITIAGTIRDGSGNVAEYVMLDQNLADWFKSALANELRRNNIGVSDDYTAADATLDIAITKFDSNLQGYAEDNLKGEAEVFYTIKEGKTTYTKRVSQTQSEFKVLKNAESFDPFVPNLLKDVIAKSASVIAQTL